MKTDNKFVKMEDHVALNPGNQGALVLAFVSISLLYFGVIGNVLLREINEGLIWHFTIYFKVLYGLPILILFFTCFGLTYVQDIYHYGIKHSFWLVPVINMISIGWFWIMYGFSADPLILLFARWQGYLHIFILYVINLSGAFAGARFKKWIEIQKMKKNIMHGGQA